MQKLTDIEQTDVTVPMSTFHETLEILGWHCQIYPFHDSQFKLYLGQNILIEASLQGRHLDSQDTLTLSR